MNKKIYERIETWRNRKIPGKHPYVYLDGICLKRSWGGEDHKVSALMAVGVDQDGFREELGVARERRNDKE